MQSAVQPKVVLDSYSHAWPCFQYSKVPWTASRSTTSNGHVESTVAGVEPFWAGLRRHLISCCWRGWMGCFAKHIFVPRSIKMKGQARRSLLLDAVCVKYNKRTGACTGWKCTWTVSCSDKLHVWSISTSGGHCLEAIWTKEFFSFDMHGHWPFFKWSREISGPKR